MLTPEEFELVRNDLAAQAYTAPTRIQSFIYSLAPAGTYFASKPLFLDASGNYQPKINYASLKGRAFVGLIHKAGEVDDTAGPDSWLDPKFVSDCQEAYLADIAYCGYIFTHCGAWWLNHNTTKQGLDDIDNAPNNTERMRKMLAQDKEFMLIVRQWAIGDGYMADPEWLKTAHFRKIYEWELDGERWWRSYNQYLAYLRKEITIDQVTRIDPTWILWSNEALFNRLVWAMEAGYLPKVPIVSYSGKWFINAYSPVYGVWLGSKETHPAVYYWPAGGVPTTVEEIATKYMQEIPDTWKDSTTYKNAMFGTPRFVQISGDRFKIPEITNMAGVMTAIDVNAYVHPQDWKVWLNFKQTEPPPVDPGNPPPTTTCDMTEVLARLDLLQKDVTDIRNHFKP